MQLFTTVQEAKDIHLSLTSKTVGFIPTMGSLHDGHLALIKEAQKVCEVVIVSIFVNPTQFGPTEDFDSYPRTIDSDLKQLETLAVDYVFTPTTTTIYPTTSMKTSISIPDISKLYCGASRPAFFDGICAVVLRLFNIIKPTHAFFGEKDYQQYKIIQHMAADLFLDIHIQAVPIIRQENGLALSSRNAYLSEQEQIEATCIYTALNQAVQLYKKGETNTSTLTKAIRNFIEANSNIVIDYCAGIDHESLLEKETLMPEDRLLIAGYLNKTRLIDNMRLM
ncbi:pantoate--beta-alanine ligase [Candidatus Marinamargulisbacteria bacterium SCGC AG-414-C22]|nr:pantoate--beta-alanine ligase [Candidatus Marinamargulisbacteria bacterium SCGC AG-414-C22]